MKYIDYFLLLINNPKWGKSIKWEELMKHTALWLAVCTLVLGMGLQAADVQKAPTITGKLQQEFLLVAAVGDVPDMSADTMPIGAGHNHLFCLNTRF